MAGSEKTVLVHLRERVRPVKFVGSAANAIDAIWGSFHDVLCGDEQLVLQVMSNIFLWTADKKAHLTGIKNY